MACARSFTLNQKVEEDIPLDQAIYSATADKIYGVRGKWVYRFNATTGAKEAELRFTDLMLGESYICELGTNLYISGWRSCADLIQDPSGLNSIMRPERDVFEIDRSAFTVTGPLGLGDSLIGAFPGPGLQSYVFGYRNLFTIGSEIFGFASQSNKWFRFDPTNLAGAVFLNFNNPNSDAILDIAYDPAQSAIWTTSAASREAYVADTNYDISSNSAFTTPSVFGVAPAFRGLCVSPANIKVYAVTGTGDLVKINANVAYATMPAGFSNATYSVLTILDAAATPVKIRYNAVDGLIYIPTLAHDTVEVLNPATDTIVAIKTGFVDPLDVVFTPTKKWAVQNSGKGLQEIT